jgi:hypothetical protein
MALVFIAVDRKDIGDLEMEFGNGESFSGEALVLECLMVDTETREKQTVTLVVPKTQGFRLVSALLTEDQLDAVLSA